MKQPLRDSLYHVWRAAISLNRMVCDVIAPAVCAACKTFVREDVPLCAQCARSVHPVVSYQLPITQRYAVTVFAVSKYEGIVQQLIRAKQGRKIYAARAVGFLIWGHTNIRLQEFDYIVPVPLHWRRYAARGYNQAAEIAGSLSEKSGKPLLNCLQRIRATAVQASLSAEERKINVQEAFVVKKKLKECIAGKRILLVDDVLTTGSTLEACVRTLRAERPLLIIIAVGARVV